MSDNKEFDAYCARLRAKWGDKFSDAQLWPQFRPYYATGQRVKVSGSGSGSERTGYVKATAGYLPAFILMSSTRARGSADVLSADDRVTHVRGGQGARYLPVAQPPAGAAQPEALQLAGAGPYRAHVSYRRDGWQHCEPWQCAHAHRSRSAAGHCAQARARQLLQKETNPLNQVVELHLTCSST